MPENQCDDGLPPGVFLVPVEVVEQRSSFVVVKVRADSLSDAQDRAIEKVEELCLEDELGLHLGYSFEWTHDHYEAGGLAEVDGEVTDYGDDIDLTSEEEPPGQV